MVDGRRFTSALRMLNFVCVMSLSFGEVRRSAVERRREGIGALALASSRSPLRSLNELAFDRVSERQGPFSSGDRDNRVLGMSDSVSDGKRRSRGERGERGEEEEEEEEMEEE